jgi:hypothetical protein
VSPHIFRRSPGSDAGNSRKGWRRGGESNPRIKVLQTSALPLGYRAGLFQFTSTLFAAMGGCECGITSVSWREWSTWVRLGGGLHGRARARAGSA